MARMKNKTMVAVLFKEYQRIRSLHNCITDQCLETPLIAFYDADECLDDYKTALLKCIEEPWDVKKHYDGVDTDAVENLFSNWSYIEEDWHNKPVRTIQVTQEVDGNLDENGEYLDLPF